MSQGDSLCWAVNTITIKQDAMPISLHTVTLKMTLDPVTQFNIRRLCTQF